MLALTALALLAACGRGEGAVQRRRRAVLRESPLPAAPRQAPPSPWASPGRLAVGTQAVLGMAVPRAGRVLSSSDDQARVAVDGVPFGAVERFYREYLVDGHIEKMGRGTRFTEAHPRAPGDPSRRVDVIVTQAPGGAVVAIFDHTPRGRRPPKGVDVARAARDAVPPTGYSKRVPGVTE